MLLQIEGGPKLRNLGKEDLNQNLSNKYFVPVNLWGHVIHPVIYEAKKWEFAGFVSDFVIGKQVGHF